MEGASRDLRVNGNGHAGRDTLGMGVVLSDYSHVFCTASALVPAAFTSSFVSEIWAVAEGAELLQPNVGNLILAHDVTAAALRDWGMSAADYGPIRALQLRACGLLASQRVWEVWIPAEHDSRDPSFLAQRQQQADEAANVCRLVAPLFSAPACLAHLPLLVMHGK